jgi:hypothetical protein
MRYLLAVGLIVLLASSAFAVEKSINLGASAVVSDYSVLAWNGFAADSDWNWIFDGSSAATGAAEGANVKAYANFNYSVWGSIVDNASPNITWNWVFGGSDQSARVGSAGSWIWPSVWLWPTYDGNGGAQTGTATFTLDLYKE